MYKSILTAIEKLTGIVSEKIIIYHSIAKIVLNKYEKRRNSAMFSWIYFIEIINKQGIVVYYQKNCQ